MSRTTKGIVSQLTYERQVEYAYGFAAGLRAGGGPDLWVYLDCCGIWLVDEVTQRESPRLHRPSLLDSEVLYRTLVRVVRERDKWPPMADYKDLPPGSELFAGPDSGEAP